MDGVLHRAERRKAVNRVAADHAEAQTVGGIALPARFQLQILGPVGDKAALGAPSGTQTVDFQRFGGKTGRKRGNTAQRKAGKHLKGHRCAAGIFHTRHDLRGGVVCVQRQGVGVGKAAGIGQRGQNDRFIVRFLYNLPIEHNSADGGTVAHGAPAAEKGGCIVRFQLCLHQRLGGAVGADNFTLTAGGNQHQLDHAGFALAAVNGGQPAYRNAVDNLTHDFFSFTTDRFRPRSA